MNGLKRNICSAALLLNVPSIHVEIKRLELLFKLITICYPYDRADITPSLLVLSEVNTSLVDIGSYAICHENDLGSQ
jgi:hypothetical protein